MLNAIRRWNLRRKIRNMVEDLWYAESLDCYDAVLSKIRAARKELGKL